ncbi:MAG: hypothetical protein HC881_18115 [Leptolyngbyaceae cyanobacterium SL_7_1]|nr:hypothetical protein [Leptolyngbyaceae cyanobacterium SL_7_1]
MSHFGSFAPVPIGEAIITKPPVVAPTTLLSEAILPLVCHPVGCTLVMEQQQIVGIVTKADIVGAIAPGRSQL